MTAAEELADLRARLAAKVAVWRTGGGGTWDLRQCVFAREFAAEIEAELHRPAVVEIELMGEQRKALTFRNVDALAEPVYAFGEREQ